MKNVLLKGKIVFGYCGSHDTIIVFAYIDEYNERIIRNRGMSVVKNLEEVCLHNLLKNCNLQSCS